MAICFVMTGGRKPTCSGKIMTHGGCAANTHGQRHTCTVPKIMTITNIWVHQQTSEGVCNYMETIPANWGSSDGGVFTFNGNEITVDGGCRAVFTVCYDGK